ncbi:heme exporter protein CcmD [bacterium]|nr:heme exporter protein CcmD [bacterium]
MSEFFAMGGYGAFVWPCFGLTAIVLVLNVVFPRAQHAALRKEIEAEWLEDDQ